MIGKGKISFLVLLVVTVNLFAFVSGDTECINGGCSIGVSIDVSDGSFMVFSGSVRNLSGELIGNTNVTVLGTNYSTLSSNGIYDITGILDGFYNLTASADGHLNQTRTNQLAVTGITTSADFTLARVGLLKGDVLDFFAGTGINNADVTLALYGTDIKSALTDINGHYEFSNLAPGYYDVSVSAAGFTTISKPDVHVLGGMNTTANFWVW